MACYTGKKCQNGKNFFPPRTVISVAWWWAKKKLHFVHSSQSYGGSKFNVPKNGAKVPYFNADWGLGSRFGPQHEQKRSKWWAKKNLDFGHSSQSYKWLKFCQKVALYGCFLSRCSSLILLARPIIWFVEEVHFRRLDLKFDSFELTALKRNLNKIFEENVLYCYWYCNFTQYSVMWVCGSCSIFWKL